MSEERLVVKFNWDLRKGSADAAEGKTPEQCEDKHTRYRRRLKEKPDQYQVNKKRDRERKKESYVPVKNYNKNEQDRRREMWAGNKRKQRAEKRKRQATPKTCPTDDMTVDIEPKKKKLKDMNKDERSEYFRLKMRESRSRTSRQKKMASCAQRREEYSNRTETDISAATTVQTPRPSDSERRNVRRKRATIEKAMPKSPGAYAATVEKLIDSATPKKKAAMKRKGIGRSLDFSTCDNINMYVRQLKTKQSDKNRLFLYRLSQAVGKYSRRLGISWKIRKRARSGNITVKRVQRKGRVLSEETKGLVHQFWLSSDVSRPLPLKKRVKKQMPMFLLETTYTGAYNLFKKAYPNVKIGYVAFILLKPAYVRHMKSLERIVCCCPKCEKPKLLAKALNDANAANDIQERLPVHSREISDFTLCPYEGKYPKIECVRRQCESCGTKKVVNQMKKLFDIVEHENRKYPYDVWEKVAKYSEKTKKTSKVTELVTKEATATDILAMLKTDLERFSEHLFRASWQQSQLKLRKENMAPKSATLIIDYAENFSCTYQDEVQSAHWANSQVTIHPVMAFVNDTDVWGPFSKKESIIFISDDRKHDADGVAHFMSITYPYLQEKFNVGHFEEFSDCCASQYKCAKSLMDNSFHTNDFGSTATHDYFEPSHGKSCADGLAAIVKNAASKAVTRRECKIRDAKEMFKFCEKNLSSENQEYTFQSQAARMVNSNKKFFFVKKCEVNRDRKDREAKTVPGTQKIHQVKSEKAGIIKCRHLSCYCDGCRHGGGQCTNVEITGPWKTVVMKPIGNTVVTGSDGNESDDETDIEEYIENDASILEDQTHQVMPDQALVGGWCVVKFGKKLYAGLITKLTDDTFEIKCMHPCGRNKFVWPEMEDRYWYEKDEIVAIIPEPTKITSRYYSISDAHWQIIEAAS